jgi:cytochrome P450
LLTFAAKAIKERKERGSDHQDVLDQLFEVQKEKPELDDICITSMVASNIFAGSDSTSITVSAFIYHIIKNPQYKARLVAEIDEAAKANNIKHGEIFPIDVGNNMQYLQACLQEAIRCHPAVGMNLGRVAPPQGVEIDGTYIPGGVRPHSTDPLLLYEGSIPWSLTKSCFSDRRWSECVGGSPAQRDFR